MKTQGVDSRESEACW